MFLFQFLLTDKHLSPQLRHPMGADPTPQGSLPFASRPSRGQECLAAQALVVWP